MASQQGSSDVTLQLRLAILTPWLARHAQYPDVLFHYTTADGLVGVLTSRSFWMTSLRYMNDLSELQYAKDLIGDVIASRAALPSNSSIAQEFLRRIQGSYDLFATGTDVYAICFCATGNLLSQWRAYGARGGGYACGFDFFQLQRLIPKDFTLRQVIYDSVQQREIVEQTLGRFCETAERRAQTDPDTVLEFLPDLCRTFSAVVADYMFSFKHPEFAEEQEWRLVTFRGTIPMGPPSSAEPPTKFRTYNGNIIPYFELSLANAFDASKEDTLGIGFPVVELVIGPTLNPELNEQSAQLLLRSINTSFVPYIRRSGIPLRWL
jgi:hypothetical protein